MSFDGHPIPYVIDRGGNTAAQRIGSDSRIEIVGRAWRIIWAIDWLDQNGAVIPGSHQDLTDDGVLSTAGTAISFFTGEYSTDAVHGTFAGGIITIGCSWVLSAPLESCALVFQQ